MTFKNTAFAAAAAGVLLPGSVAQAHVSLHPNAIPQGSFVTTNVRVPNEQDGASVTSVRIKMPEGVLSALGAPPAGWTYRTVTKKLATPIKTDDGTVTSEVTEVSFTGGRIGPGEFGYFPLSLNMPDSAKQGAVVAFPTVQGYSNGQVDRWIGSATDDKPAPTVDITAPGTAVLDVTGGDAGPPAKLPVDLAGRGSGAGSATIASPPATTVVKKQESKGLSIAALIVGLLGLLAAGIALATRRSDTASPKASR